MTEALAFLKTTKAELPYSPKHPKIYYFEAAPVVKCWNCDPLIDAPIRYHTIKTHRDRNNALFQLGFGVIERFIAIPNALLNTQSPNKNATEENKAAIHLLAYTSFISRPFRPCREEPHTSIWPRYYKFIYAQDTFWSGNCKWTVDSIKPELALGSADKNLAMENARVNYSYDVHLQCIDCSKHLKNNKGECLCGSRSLPRPE